MSTHFFIPGDANAILEQSIYARKIVNGLRQKGHDVKVNELPGDFPFPSDDSIQKYVKLVQSVPESEPIVFDVKTLASTPYVLKDIYQHNPVIAIVNVPLSANPQYSAYQRTMITSLEQESYSYVSSFVALSEFSSQQVQNLGVEAKKISVITPGVTRTKTKETYPQVPHNLISIATLSRNRDHSLLVRAFSALKGKKWKLDCYSNFSYDPAYRESLEEMISRYDLTKKFFLHELKTDELEEALADSDLFVHPAEFESYGIWLAEALAHGIPVVASTGGGIPDTVPPEMGSFYKPGDVYGLASILEELFENPFIYNKICSHAATYHESSQTWEKSIEAFEQLIKAYL